MTDPAHLKGMLLMLGATMCWSTGGVLVRRLSFADGWEIVLWRSAFMVLFMAGVMAATYGRRAWIQLRAVGWAGVASGAFMAATFFFFLLSVTKTKVANTLVIMSILPFLAALAGQMFLGERVAGRTWASMAIGLSGIAIMFVDSLGSGGALGDLLALGVPIAMTANLLLLRHLRARVDMAPSVLLSGLISLPIALPFALPFEAAGADFAVLAALGTVQLGMGCLFMTMAARHLSAAEVALLTLFESILGSLWAWLGASERPGDLALVGMVLTIGALFADQIPALRARRT